METLSVRYFSDGSFIPHRIRKLLTADPDI